MISSRLEVAVVRQGVVDPPHPGSDVVCQETVNCVVTSGDEEHDDARETD